MVQMLSEITFTISSHFIRALAVSPQSPHSASWQISLILTNQPVDYERVLASSECLALFDPRHRDEESRLCSAHDRKHHKALRGRTVRGSVKETMNVKVKVHCGGDPGDPLLIGDRSATRQRFVLIVAFRLAPVKLSGRVKSTTIDLWSCASL
jgi:hypothetical protein